MSRRLLENGDARLLNNGDLRLLEPPLVAGAQAVEVDEATPGTPWSVVVIESARGHESDKAFKGDFDAQWIVFGVTALESDAAIPGSNNLAIPDQAPHMAMFDRTSVVAVNANRQTILDSTTFATLENR